MSCEALIIDLFILAGFRPPSLLAQAPAFVLYYVQHADPAAAMSVNVPECDAIAFPLCSVSYYHKGASRRFNGANGAKCPV